VFFNYNITKMIQAKAFHFFLLLMGSHGYVLGSSEADRKIKASVIQQDQATLSLKEGLLLRPWTTQLVERRKGGASSFGQRGDAVFERRTPLA
jgi:hypothetical protein